eukprot:SAG25_NODE_476_length_7542_cov_3.148193_3_plen_39_part_00
MGKPELDAKYKLAAEAMGSSKSDLLAKLNDVSESLSAS